VALPPAAIDFGGEAEQIGDLARLEGRAEVLHEHRGPKEIVADIRLKGAFKANFEAPCARCVDPVEHGFPATLTCFFALPAWMPRAEHAISTPETEIGYYEMVVLRLKTCSGNRCSCPCRPGRYASQIAKGFARAAARTATKQPAPAIRVRATRAGKRWLA
jgi:hypothetical protein